MVSEGRFDYPPDGLARVHFDSAGDEVGGEELALRLDALGVAHGHYAELLGLVPPLPQGVLDMELLFDGGTPALGLHDGPVVDQRGLGECCRGRRAAYPGT